jgi:mono/diheme cytochrome c family protein
MPAAKRLLARAAARHRGLFFLGAFSAALMVAGCSVELLNRQAAQELAQQSKPPGSVYTGWRVFQDRCSACHGSAGTGTAVGPDLTPLVRTMSARQFVAIVLKRYDWGLAAAQAGSDGAAREALIDEFVARRQGALTMPAMAGEPRVNAHIVDLYAYLSARAEGTQGPDRPAQ